MAENSNSKANAIPAVGSVWVDGNGYPTTVKLADEASVVVEYENGSRHHARLFDFRQHFRETAKRRHRAFVVLFADGGISEPFARLDRAEQEARADGRFVVEIHMIEWLGELVEAPRHG